MYEGTQISQPSKQCIQALIASEEMVVETVAFLLLSSKDPCDYFGQYCFDNLFCCLGFSPSMLTVS
jgi:hypothetical protein